MRSREKERRRRREHEEKMEGRVVIRSDSFACDDHCSVRLMKTHEHSRRSHLTSLSGRSSRTSSSHRPISGPSLSVFLPLCPSQSLSVDLGRKSQVSAANHREWLIESVLVSCLLVRVVGLLLQGHRAREKAMVVNLEFIKAIVTAKEVLLLDPLCQEVLPFVDQLRQQLPHKSVSKSQGGGQMDVQDNEMQLSSEGQWLPVLEAVEGLQCDLPFEFQVLDIALKVVCTYLDSSVADLERNAYSVLDELVRNVSTKNLEPREEFEKQSDQFTCTGTKGV